jgi:hypothetical protein
VALLLTDPISKVVLQNAKEFVVSEVIFIQNRRQKCIHNSQEEEEEEFNFVCINLFVTTKKLYIHINQ